MGSLECETLQSTRTLGLLGASLRRLGSERQLRQLQEECTELATAISHVCRSRDGAFEHMCDELGQVLMLANQIRLMRPDLVDASVDRNVQRLRVLTYGGGVQHD